ncbi:MAG TPA: HDOD domain-containing protein [Steroidobacteraceae bacterium]|nr:HDOD domain-containing protein [Steroidobacteraceae bacterium]
MTSITTPAPSEVAFTFIRSLAAELSGGKVDLPSFPEVAVRVRRVLADPKSSVEQVVRVVGSEAALAARLLRIANSASMNRSGKQISDLRTAVSRIGYNMVRSASISFAMAQIRNGNKLKGLEGHLESLWQASTRVAAFAFVLARASTRVNPDEALLAGMMHGIGKLYVLTRAASHPDLFADQKQLADILAEWHPAIGKAILESWDFPESLAQAVGDQHDLSRREPAAADLSDVLAVSVVMAQHASCFPDLVAALEGTEATRRLRLDETRMRALVMDSASEIKALSQALGA